MKIYKYLIVLLPFLVFAHPNAGGYRKAATGRVNLPPDYPDFNQPLILSDFIYNSDPALGNQPAGAISITNNVLTASFNIAWPQQAMKVGIIKQLNIYPVLPNMELGPVLATAGGAQTGYFAKIENNNVVIYSPYYPESLNTPVPIAISPNMPNNTFSTPGLIGPGPIEPWPSDITITIRQNRLSFTYDSIGTPSLNGPGSPIGAIYQFPEYANDGEWNYPFDIYDIDLGILQNNYRNTIYRAKIENEVLIIYTTEALPPLPSGCYLNFTSNLTQGPPMWYRDADSDGFGSVDNTATGTPTPPAGYVADNTDCDDTNERINPDTIWYADRDGDTYGETDGLTAPITACIQPAGYAIRSGDCNDGDASLNPQTEWTREPTNGNYYPIITGCYQPPGYTDHYSTTPGNPPGGGTNPCIVNGVVLDPATVWYQDQDGDRYGSSASTATGCRQPPGYVSNFEDCNDSDAEINPDTRWYADQDNDGLGDPQIRLTQCLAPVNYVRNRDDNDPLMPGNHNYVITKAYKQATTTPFILPGPDQAKVNITYFDGLGKPVQQIANQQSNTGKDIITHISYDAMGRQEKQYLAFPAATTNMVYDPDSYTKTLSYYNTPKYENTVNPYSQVQFEASPLGRVLQQAAPGNDWAIDSGHTIKMDYQANTTADEVHQLHAITTWDDAQGVYNIRLSDQGIYSTGELYKTITKDENWTGGTNHTTEEFKDKEGRVVLKRTYSTVNNVSEAHDTYYVYDKYGNLTYVVPPKARGVIDNNNLQSDITSTIVTAPGSTLQLSATNSITLLPGFHAQEGSTFTATIASGNLDDLCYQYKYDGENKIIEKKLPGKGWEYIVYDKLDRPVLTQDPNLRAQNKWLFTKYDAFSRPVYTGDYTNTVQTTRADVQALAIAATVLYESRQSDNTINESPVYYSNNAFPNTPDINLFTINYYDDYGFNLDGGTAEDAYGVIPSTRTKGLTTGTKTTVIGSGEWITNVVYYDDKARPIYNYSNNGYLLTTDKVKLQLDFTGKTLQSTATHFKVNAIPNTAVIVVDTYTYDHADRLLSQKQTINGQAEETIVANTYDELGQLIGEGIGGKTTRGRLQNVDYGYNIRGWLKTINNPDAIGNDLFTFRLHYNDPANTTPALYNGNISQTYWKSANSDNNLRHYDYRYDALNRLTFATDNQDRYNENLAYDKNGNIMNLTRKGATNTNATAFGIMDQLTYHYDAGNKLLKVQDMEGEEGFKDGANTGDDYTYDNNGNMTNDANKGITSITYNHLNLPVEIITATGVIHYAYDATGAKQVKEVYGGRTQESIRSITYYAGAYNYEWFPESNCTLQFFSQPEGYVAYNNGTFSYIYQYKDHLGNNRLSYSDSNNDGQVTASEIVEEDNYYPFGLKHKGYNWIINGVEHMYKYNGKELQKELGLNMYDYGARNYDPALGRWMNIDPLAEKMRRHSPYNYVFNNPIRFTDPDGMAPQDHIFSSTGVFIRDTKVGNAVKIQIGNQLYSPSQLNTSIGSIKAMAKIGAFYAGKIGADVGTKISAAKGDDSSNKNPAFTTGQTIKLNTNGGFSKSLDDISNFKSIMKHENNHKEDNENSKFESTLSTHADVYINQMSDSSFKSTTDEFKTGTAASFANYLLNMDQSPGFGVNQILSKVDTFNAKNTGGLQLQAPGHPFSKGTMYLDLIYENKTAPIEYEKVNN
ncbi:MAG TPA: DUF6443 domain-containing protein [Flavobacterium sp.]|jgi:RHS repeat-associated protein